MAKFIVGLIGVGGILTLLILMNVYQPYSDDVLVYQPVARIGARVAGRVVEITVQANRPLQEGDVLFRIDDVPYQADVDRLKAALAEAEQHIPVLKAAVAISTKWWQISKPIMQVTAPIHWNNIENSMICCT